MKRMQGLDNETFEELIIVEEDKSYLVKLTDQENEDFSIRYDKSSIDNVVDLIEMYLSLNKINKISNKFPSINDFIRKSYIEIVNLDNKKLKISVYGAKMRLLFDMVLNKYIADRTYFLENSDAKEIKFSAKRKEFMYEEKDGCINVCFSTDSNGNIIQLERETMKEYLYNKFDSLGENVKVEMIKERFGKDIGCIVTCGDFKITFPRTYTFSLILALVNEYKNEINKSKKR